MKQKSEITDDDGSRMISNLPKKLWLIVVGIVCLPLVVAFIVAIFLAFSTEGSVFLSGCAFFGISFVGLFFAIPIAVFVIFVARQSRAYDRDQKVTYDTFAKSVNGRVFRDKTFWWRHLLAIEFMHRGLHALITSEYQRAGAHYIYYSCFVLDLPRPTPFRCDIAPRNFLDFRSKAGLEDVELGIAEFDQTFRLRANDKLLARQCIDANVQQGLADLAQFSKEIRTRVFDPGRAYIAIDETYIKCHVLGVFSTADEMDQFYRRASNVADHLLPHLFRKTHS